MSWAMRYTFHAGYEPPDMRAQFRSSLGTDDPAAHVRYAAKQGVSGILYPWALDRSPEEVANVRSALTDTGLSCSCIVSADSSLLFTPFWTDRSADGRAKLSEATERACKLAVSLGAGVIVAFVMTDGSRQGAPDLRDDVAANLAEMASMAADHGLAIGIEPMILPGLMFQSVASALDVIRRTDRPNVGLIYDTGHVALTEGALMPAFLESFDHLVLLQLADLPGRVEPGAGTLDLVPIAAEAIKRGYTGLVDLEHSWASLSPQGELEGLRRLHKFDAAVRAAAGFKTANSP